MDLQATIRKLIRQQITIKAKAAQHGTLKKDDETEEKMRKAIAELDDLNEKLIEHDDNIDEIDKYSDNCLILIKYFSPNQPRPFPNIQFKKRSLPQFEGDVFEFKGFMEEFEDIVDFNLNLPAKEKFYTLKSVLKSSPLVLIKNLPVANDSYEIAKQILQNEYGDPIKVKMTVLKRLDQLAKVNKNNLDKCKSTYQTMLDLYHCAKFIPI